MKKNKGFTLIELLAMMVVLGLLMGVTIPNISGMLENQKRSIIASDVTKMVNKTKNIYAQNNDVIKPEQGKCVIFSLNFINNNEEIKTGPNNGNYDLYESMVVVTRSGNRYFYYVKLVENYGEKTYGIDFVDIESDDFKNSKVNLINGGIEKFNLQGNEDDLNITKFKNKTSVMCDIPIQHYYVK